MSVVFAMVSTDVRRDLLAPLRHMTRLRVVHLYRRAPYRDLAADELDDSLVRYRTPLDLFAVLWRVSPSVIQAVEPFAIRLLPYLLAVFLASWLRRVPLVIVTLENRPLGVKHGPLLARVLRLALRPVFGHASLIVHLNDGASGNALSVGDFKTKMRRAMYGTWGADLDEFSPVRTEIEQDPEPDTILFVGRLHPEKGVDDLLDAFAFVVDARPAARLILAGDGPSRPDIERTVAARGWGGRVALLGAVKNRELPRLLRSATLVCCPSVTTRKWEEQVGMTNIQAMACGVPVVTTRSGAIPEFVPDSAALLVPEHDPPRLAAAILELLADSERCQRMGAAGRAWTMEHYDAQRNVLAAEDMLLGLLPRSAVAGPD